MNRQNLTNPRNVILNLQLGGISSDKILHIAQSIYYDIIPAKAVGLSTVWVNRRKGKGGYGTTPQAISYPDLEVRD